MEEGEEIKHKNQKRKKPVTPPWKPPKALKKVCKEH
jgi:hypothetical protein